MADLEHEEWLRQRGSPVQKKLDRVLQSLREVNDGAGPEPGDELPAAYVSVLGRKDA